MESKNIYQRLHEVMKAVSYVQKEEKKVNNQYRFVSHDAVTGAIRPHLIDNGVLCFPQNLKVVQNGNRTEAFFDLRFINVDNPEDFLDVPTFGYGIDAQDKGVGKAMSYGVKYGLLKALSLETGDDPEKDSIDYKPEQKGIHIQMGADDVPADEWINERMQRMQEYALGDKPPTWRVWNNRIKKLENDPIYTKLTKEHLAVYERTKAKLEQNLLDRIGENDE